MATVMFLIILFTLTFIKMMIQAIYLTHRLQQLGYYNLKFIKWLQSSQYREVLIWNILELLLPLFIILVLFFNIKNLPVYKYITSTTMLITFSWKIVHPFIKKWVTFKSKVPLVLTARVKRLLFTFALIVITLLISIFIFTATPFDEFTLQTWSFFRLNASILFITVVSPIIMLMANILNMPIEKLIYYIYFTKAKKKIKLSNVIKIAITGSYGKTSTKFFLSTILNEKEPTFHTPASYNTPMGISKVINDKNFFLKNYKYFVIEMGADKTGDINKLCKLAKPDFAIVTAIGYQHLDTFLTVENIIKTKLSLFKNLSQKGFGVYNYDSELLRENVKAIDIKVPLYSYSMSEDNKEIVDIYAKNIKHSKEGLSFTVCPKDEKNFQVNTRLLGRHNVSNLLAAIITAKKLGLTNEDIKKGISKIEPVEHRLQMIKAPTGVTIIDDAFNSNPTGAYEALLVLKEINGGKKIIVTPGMIGLGEKEKEINQKFGNQIAECVDIAILVGKKRTESIYHGIIEKNFPLKNIIVVSSLNQAKTELAKIVQKDDIVLFENDLPDAYNE